MVRQLLPLKRQRRGYNCNGYRVMFALMQTHILAYWIENQNNTEYYLLHKTLSRAESTCISAFRIFGMCFDGTKSFTALLDSVILLEYKYCKFILGWAAEVGEVDHCLDSRSTHPFSKTKFSLSFSECSDVAQARRTHVGEEAGAQPPLTKAGEALNSSDLESRAR